MTDMDTSDLPVSTEKLVSLEKKLSKAAERGRGVQLSAEEVDLFVALGAYERIALAVAAHLRRVAVTRIYRRAGQPLPESLGGPPPRSNPDGEPEPTPVQERPYSPAQLGERWDVSTATVIARIKRGELPAFQIGPRSYRVRPEDVIAYEEARA